MNMTCCDSINVKIDDINYFNITISLHPTINHEIEYKIYPT